MDARDIAETILSLQEAKVFSAKHNRSRHSPADAKKKYRTADLRKIEHYANFGATYLVYNIDTDEEINLTTHKDSLKDAIVFAKRCLTGVLRSVFEDVRTRKNTDNQLFDRNSIVHMYMHLKGLDNDFRFNASGEDHKTLDDFLNNPDVIEKVVNKFSEIIQSGKPVILSTGTEIRVVLYEPPRDNGQTDNRTFMGAGGWGHNNGLIAFTTEELATKSHGVVCIKNNDKMCMARAIVVGIASNNRDTDKSTKSFFKNITDPKRKEQERAAVQLYMKAGIHTSKACDKTDLEKFAEVADVNIVVYELNHTFFDKVYDSVFVEGRPDVFLLYNAEKKHYDCITNIDAVARAIKNNRRTFCSVCRKIVTPLYHESTIDKGYHNCYRSDHKKSYTINNEIVFHEPDYDLMDESTDRTANGFIKVNEKNTLPVPNEKIWYFDFETSVIGVHNETKEREQQLSFEEEELYKHALARGMANYQPFPFFKRHLHTEYYTYTQVVNYVEMQCADGDESKTMTFRNIDEFCQVLTRPEFKGATLIAHYGQGFDFQLLYQYMFRYDSVIQGKLIDPVMRGNKIIKGYLFNDITLIDSFNYLSQGLSTFPKMFDLEELSKGYFPHFFNITPFQNYKGPIPDKEWYGYREMKPAQQRAFILWHDQQVAQKVEFDFQAEMRKYCHSDVDILRRGMQEFRRLFIEMKDVNTEKELGTDPLLYMTIAALAYDGVYRRHYLLPDTIKYVGRPKRGNYSAVSIEWMEYVMTKRNVFIQHAENNEEYEAMLYKPSGEAYLKKVDGYDRDTNTIYEFAGCFYHSCKYCYPQDQMHPLKSDMNSKEKKVFHGHVYATTMRIFEDIKNAGYNLEVMWECEWQRLKKKENTSSNVDLYKRLPLNPRDAYYGGRTNAVSLYKKVTGTEKIFYIDVVSMYPTVMSLPQYWYPIGQHEVRRFDDPTMPLVPLEELFGFQKCRVIPPTHLYHPVLPERSEENGKLLFPLYPITGTWTHVELQKAVSLGYTIDEVYEQHHFPPTNRSNTLFSPYIQTFFEMKKKAEQDKNPGLKQVAKLCLNSFYGKFGFNVENQDATKIIRNRNQLWNVINSSYKRSNVDVINNAVAIATYHINDEYSVHTKSNVYIAAYVTAYARLKLYEALEILQDKALYFDTDSCVYVSPNGEHIIPISDSGDLGTWSDELKDTPGDYFTEFVSGRCGVGRSNRSTTRCGGHGCSSRSPFGKLFDHCHWILNRWKRRDK